MWTYQRDYQGQIHLYSLSDRTRRHQETNYQVIKNGGLMTVPDTDRLAGTQQELGSWRAGELERWVIVCFPPWSPTYCHEAFLSPQLTPQSWLPTLLAPLNEWLTGTGALLAEYANTEKLQPSQQPLGQVSHSIGLNWKLGPTVTWLSNQLELIISWLGSHQDLTGSRTI